MTMGVNGTRAYEDEAAYYGLPEATEWEAQESQYSNPELELQAESPYSSPEAHELESLETHESHYSSPYATEMELGEAALEDEAGFEDELGYSAPESTEWESTEAQESPYANPYSNAHPYSNAYSTEDESDRFLGGLLSRALPLLGRAIAPAARQLIPQGKRAVRNVLQDVLGSARPAQGRLPASTQATLNALLRQFGSAMQEAEAETHEVEAQLFGSNEFEGELAATEHAHEAALTEVLAAEAAHAEDEAEAEALLGAALPISVRVMGGGRAVRYVMPTLIQSNRRLVHSIRRSNPAGPQLLRVIPAIQRRTVAALRARHRAGQRITPRMVAQIMSTVAARVLSDPRQSGPAIVRNISIRRATVAPIGRSTYHSRRGARRPY
jgi:hypothetical protein